MSQVSQPYSCIIIGAGMTGLTAARYLVDKKINCLVIDKGRGVGGRMATRYIDGARIDHGAQYFTAHDARFQKIVALWEKSDVAGVWSKSFPDITHAESNGHPRYFGTHGMNTIPKYLAEGLPVRIGGKVVTVRKTDSFWEVFTEAGDIFRAHVLLMTPPAPQALPLLRKGDVPLSPDDLEKLAAIEYDTCIAVLAVLNDLSSIPHPGGMNLNGNPIDWVADNRQKGISPGAHAITIHASAEFSKGHWNVDDKTIADFLINTLGEQLGTGNFASQVKTVQVHRWRYSRATRLYSEPYLFIGDTRPLIFAGDAFHTPGVEGAYLSGLAAAEAVEKAMA